MALTDQALLDDIAAHPGSGRAAIRRRAAPDLSAPTVYRALKRLVDEGKLEVTGKGRATGYRLAGTLVIRGHLTTPPHRRKPAAYNKEFIDRYLPNKTFYLGAVDRDRLHDAGRPVPPLPAGTYTRRILDRLLVDLSWASSRMEGSTYDLLETERLIRFGEEASGKDHREAVMILNHKAAIEHIVDHLAEIAISRRDLCDLHALLADGLLVDPAMAGRLRRMPVAITASSYRPLDDRFAIDEEFDVLIHKAAGIGDPFEQAFFLLVHIPYLQAFEDVNKRTSRLAANIPLLKADLAPMSFLAMDDRHYIDGLIGIYELNNVALLRDAFVDAYLISADKYRALGAEVAAPEKAALAYRDFVRQAVRRCVLEWKAFRPEAILEMTAAAEIPQSDRAPLVDYIRRELRGLHEGNVIRYRLQPVDLEGLARE